MDKTSAWIDEHLREGFAGQRMVVVPEPAVEAACTRPVTSSLTVTDAGMFPTAAHHGRERPDGSRQHIVLVCTRGAGWVHLDSQRIAVGRGDAVTIPAHTPHEYRADSEDPWTLWWCHIEGPDADTLVGTVREAAGGPISHLRDAAPVASLMSQIIDGLDSSTRGGLVRSSGAAWHVLSHLVATGRRMPGGSATAVERAVAHLRATSPHRTSVADLAAMVGLSPARLTALFREQIGMPPLRYLTSLRMALARELLDSTDLSVTEVATQAGYADALYFSRHFTREHGLSPSKYRARTH